MILIIIDDSTANLKKLNRYRGNVGYEDYAILHIFPPSSVITNARSIVEVDTPFSSEV